MIYNIGLIFVILVIFVGLDDLIWDIVYLFKRLTGKLKRTGIDVKDVEAIPPKMLGIMIAAYNEENVLKEVVENMIKSSQYPRSMYHIFLGVYPNDPETQRVADELVKNYKNVHKVVHVLDGPSSKADNLNNIIKNIYTFEEENKVEFSALIVHDSEDLIHPFEFRLENYLLEQYPAIQMPVFPLQEESSFNNIWKNLISGTYLDEFAENHYRLLFARTKLNAFVPSAGTGFVLRRDVLEAFPDYNIFPVGSLTEDYKLSLEISKMGFPVKYALENIKRVNKKGKIVREFVATRSMFPSSYRAAVRQKTRWIYGITMQSFSMKDIFKSDKLNFQSKYSLYKDWKAKFGNLLLGPGYLNFIYFILSFFIDLPVVYPKGSLSWYLMIVLTLIMLERQLLRFTAIKSVYGYRSAIISTLLPPIMPIRLVMGNIINFHSTVNAWLTRFSLKTNKNKRKVKWSKTEHDFLEEKVLERHRMNFSDILLYRGYLDKNEIKHIQRQAVLSNKKFEDVLKERELILDDTFVRIKCELEGKTYLKVKPGKVAYEYISNFSKNVLLDLKVIPLIKLNGVNYVITSLDSDKRKIEQLVNNKNIIYIYSSSTRIIESLNHPNIEKSYYNKVVKIRQYLEKNYINIEQALIALNYTEKDHQIEQTLDKMGLLKNIS